MKDPIQIQVDNSSRQGEETGHSSSETSRQIDPTQIEANARFKSDREKANPLSQLTFSYAIPMALKGIFRKKKPLAEEDLVTIPWRYRPDVISNRIAHYLEEGKQKKPKKKLNVPLAVLKAIKWSLFRITFFQTIFVCTRLFSVWVVKKLVETFVDINASEEEAYGWACALTGCLIFGYLVEHHWSCPAHYYPTLVQNALVDLLYKKITRLSSYSLTQISAGRLMNLAVNDLTFLDNYAMFLPSIFTGVVAIIVGSVIVWQSFGVFTLIGIGYIVAWWPLQEGAIVMGTKVKGETAHLTNQRVKRTSETVEGIKLLKMYNWEMKFKEKIGNIRTKELKLLKKTAIGQAISRAIAFSTVNCGTFLMFLAFVYTGHTLTIEGTMSAYLAFGYLRLFSSYFVGAALIFIEEARGVFKSLGKVLEAPEIGDVKFEEPTDRENSVEFENFTAYWQTDDPENAPESLKGKNKKKNNSNKEGKKYKKGHEQKLVHHEINPVLSEINLTLKKGSINALVGIVGSGKTSFLMTFTGEMPKTTGSLRYKGKIAYVEQEPTIFAGTFKENVLFGKPYDEKRYKEAVKACNLQSDLKLFDKGDESEITGGGNNLSGGQKARLAFARAVYADADIYLLDDPLSAVDPKVARCLYKNAIEGVLKGKTIILVTHQVDFVKSCENIIVMEKGKILGSGTLEELREKGVHPEKIFGADLGKDTHNQTFDTHSVHSEYDVSSLRQSIISKSSLEGKDKRYGGHHETQKDHVNIQIGEAKVEGKFPKAPSMPKKGKDKTDKKPEELEETKKDQVNMEIDETKKAEVKDLDGEEEDKAIVSGQNMTGQVTLKTYWNYIKEMGGIPFLILLVIVFVSLQFTIIAYVRLLGNWIAQTWPNWKIAAILGGLAGFDIFISNLMFLVLSLVLLKASKRYHQKMLDRIIGAKTLFFDSNSVGSVIDRFSKDIGTIDRFIPLCVTDILNILSYYFTIVIASGIIKPVLLPLLLGAGALSIVFLVLCYPSIQQCRLFEHRTKAPAVSLLNETLSGVVIMRLYRQSDNFHKRFKEHLHRSTKGHFNFVLASRVAGFYTDLVYIAAVIGSIFIITASSAKVANGIAESFYAAFVLALILSITGLLPHGLRQFSAVNISMASVARIQEYCNIPQEPPLEMPSDAEKSKNGWPSKGEIEMHNVNMKYRPDKDLVIKDLDLQIKPGEKIGCVGRTGAGKSSIVQLLYRMREIYRKDNGSKESCVKIDDVDTQSVGLHLLRGNISMIPQTPYIFSETVRTNIDPLGKFSDEEIWRVLEDVRLKEHIENQPGKLDAKISSRSDIFSVGQKQLVCLARVILKPSPVLIMDEATANMDYETDNFLQEKINERFADSTRITIAHRLTTIASYDRVLVLSKGKRVQYDEPYKMLVKNVGDEEFSNMEGHFASMVQNTGPISSKQIFKIAKEAYFERHGDELEQKDEGNELEHTTVQ